MTTKFLTESARIAYAYSNILNESMNPKTAESDKSATNDITSVNTTDLLKRPYLSKEENDAPLFKKEEYPEGFLDADFNDSVTSEDEETKDIVKELPKTDPLSRPYLSKEENDAPLFRKEEHPEGFLNSEDDDITVDDIKTNESVEDSADNNFYVIVDYGKGWKIHCGCEFKEDAIDASKPGECPRTKDCKIKVVARVTLKKYGLDAVNDNDWMKGLPEDAIAITEGIGDVIGKASDFLDYTYIDPATGERKVNWKEVAIDAGLLGATVGGALLAAPTAGAGAAGAGAAGTALAANMARRAALKAALKGAAKGVAKGTLINRSANKIGNNLNAAGHDTIGNAVKLGGNIAALKAIPNNMATLGLANKWKLRNAIGADIGVDLALDGIMSDGKAKDMISSGKDIALFGAKWPLISDTIDNAVGTARSIPVVSDAMDKAADYAGSAINAGKKALGFTNSNITNNQTPPSSSSSGDETKGTSNSSSERDGTSGRSNDDEEDSEVKNIKEELRKQGYNI